MAWIAYIATRKLKSSVLGTLNPGEVVTQPTAQTAQGKEFETPEYNDYYGYISVVSYKSKEHAEELVKQAYKYWLSALNN